MYYYYMCGKEKIRVFVWNDDFHTAVSVEDREKRKTYERTIREDECGKFFTWNKNRIYLNDWVRTSMKELQERIDNKERIFSDDLVHAILSDGVVNVRFEVPMPTRCGFFFVSRDKTKDVVCKIDENVRNYKVKNNYKLTLVPEKEDDEASPYEHYYISDLASLIESGYIKIVTEQHLCPRSI